MAKNYCATISATGIEGSLPLTLPVGTFPTTYITCATTPGTVTYKSYAGGANQTTYLFVGRNPIAAAVIVSTTAVGVGYESNSNINDR